jgi:alpha-mannosidase
VEDLREAKAFARDVIGPAIYPERVPLDVSARHLLGEPLPPEAAVDGPFHAFGVGDPWGGMWSTTWFRCRATVPDTWAGRPIAALIHLGGARTVGFSAEGLIWDLDLRPVQGLHHEHREYLLSESAHAGSPVDFYVEAAANPIPRWHVPDWPLLEPDYDGPPLYVLEQAELATIDRAIEALYIEVQLAIEMAEWMGDRRDAAVAALDDAFAVVAKGDREALSEARAALRPLFASGTSPHAIAAVGHAHIDTAWLWPVRETKRKCARTFANQLRLLDRYPEHHFVCSQAVQYQWMKDGYPALYEKIQARVADGRWAPVGGMWVEADSNIPSGESLVRQFVHGKRFFLEEFGVETHEMWIPDVFGYSAALPQIAAQAGIDALITQKMSWNDTNVFPHTTFWWEGHDGSRVLAHFPPANTYNGEFRIAELLNDQRNFKEADRSRHTLYPFGYGDGGGGPTAAMLERARRLRAVDGLPSVEIATVAGFLDRVRQEGADLRTWVGELYLEAHRATSTTHADVKRANRRGEEALRAAEMWSVAAGVDHQAELDPLWKLLLLNQFHDILPGSSIHWVYDDSAGEHARILDATAALIEEAEGALIADPQGCTAFNPGSYPRAGVAELPDGHLAYVEVPACGWAPLPGPAPDWPAVTAGCVPERSGAAGFIDNGILRVTYDSDGLLTSIWDHEAQREVLAAGERGNLFQLHEDRPKAFDAWDVDRDYLDHVADIVSLADPPVVTQRPLRAEVRFARRFGDSRLDQVMRLTAGSRRIEFHTEVDWHEKHRFLKVAFPVAIRSSRATYEIQHGWIERPTTENTTWDEARFEVCAQRWADLGEPGYGVALINDCKYGYDVRGHTMRLSLLRGPGYPDPEADQGHHDFAYALLPHRGDLREGRVVEEAEAFNLPIGFRPGQVAAPGQIVSVDRPGVSVEAVKWADDGDGVVVRLCEVHGARGPARVRLNLPFAAVEKTDLLERPLCEVAIEQGTVVLELRPFELLTLRFR